jgi:hypothetical protein
VETLLLVRVLVLALARVLVLPLVQVPVQVLVQERLPPEEAMFLPQVQVRVRVQGRRLA